MMRTAAALAVRLRAPLLLALAAALAPLWSASARAGEENNRFAPFFERDKKGNLDFDKPKVGTEDSPLMGTVMLLMESKKGSKKARVDTVILRTTAGADFPLEANPNMKRYFEDLREVVRPSRHSLDARIAVVGAIHHTVVKGENKFRVSISEYYEVVKGTLRVEIPEGRKEKDAVYSIEDSQGQPAGIAYVLVAGSGKNASKEFKKFLESHKDGDEIIVLGKLSVAKTPKKSRKNDDPDTYELQFWRDDSAKKDDK